MSVPQITWTIFTLRTLNSLGWSATMPFLAIYLEESRGVSLSIIGTVYLIAGLLTLVGDLLGGRMTDSIGPKKVMLIGYISSIVSALLLGVTILFDASVILILIMYPAFNLFRAMSQPATSAIVANQEPRFIRMSFSFLSIGGNLGFAIGPAIGGFLSQDFNYATVFLLSAFVAGVVTLIALLRIPSGVLLHHEKHSNLEAPRMLRIKEDRSLIAFLFLVLGSFLAVGYEIMPMSVYVAGFLNFSNIEIGYLFALNGLIIVILQLPLTKLIERLKYFVTPLIVSSFFTASAFYYASRSSTFGEFVLVMFLVTLGEIFLSVPSQTVVSLFSRAGNRGTYQGYFAAFSTSGRSLASFVGPTSFAILAFDPGLAWVAIGSFALLTAAGYFLISENLEKEYQQKKTAENSKFEST